MDPNISPSQFDPAAQDHRVDLVVFRILFDSTDMWLEALGLGTLLSRVINLLRDISQLLVRCLLFRQSRFK